MLIKFGVLKEHLVKCIVLTLNSMESSHSNKILQQILKELQLSNELRIKILVPSNDFKKINFDRYYKLTSLNEVKSIVVDYLKT